MTSRQKQWKALFGNGGQIHMKGAHKRRNHHNLMVLPPKYVTFLIISTASKQNTGVFEVALSSVESVATFTRAYIGFY